MCSRLGAVSFIISRIDGQSTFHYSIHLDIKTAYQNFHLQSNLICHLHTCEYIEVECSSELHMNVIFLRFCNDT